MRRVAVTVLAVGLVVTAEVAATLSAAAQHRPEAHKRAAAARHVSPPPYRGEPHVPQDSTIPSWVRMAAVRFVRDYSRWSSGRLAAIPAVDATQRVIRLLEQEGRHAGPPYTAEAVASVRIASTGGARYVVMSAVGNFLVDRRRSRWLVVSLPGD